ncbi:MAG: PLP-dependent aminotransferase family protein [Lachnospiraceae bacterium]|nr:PLP-dependent aminotransferase family protein [Lachnospiraceae bacterium]
MLTYDLRQADGPLYTYLYQCIKSDIIAGKLQPGEKLPSKRTFANNQGVSTITIQNAYDQLVSEGYVETQPKRGYFVADVDVVAGKGKRADINYEIHIPQEDEEEILYDLSKNEINPENFPFSIWAKVSRAVISEQKEALMKKAPTGGVRELREAIASHLYSFRGMMVDPNQIVIGAGTEYLYGIIIQLLGLEKIYSIENPGYRKLEKIYRQKGVKCKFASMDEKGILVSELERVKTDVAHICPNHHFPTGITMPASRRYEILAWANEKQGRYIIEDDYDSEFRMSGKPLPPLFSIDGCEKVIYMNTFSKSLTPTIRISYMVLPVHLANRFYETMSFYACTVSNFEQYTLARFIKEGYFEKHINRMRLYYKRQRRNIIKTIEDSWLGKVSTIIENDSGLHFLLKLENKKANEEFQAYLKKHKIKVNALSDYQWGQGVADEYVYIVNYSPLGTGAMSFR